MWSLHARDTVRAYATVSIIILMIGMSVNNYIILIIGNASSIANARPV